MGMVCMNVFNVSSSKRKKRMKGEENKMICFHFAFLSLVILKDNLKVLFFYGGSHENFQARQSQAQLFFMTREGMHKTITMLLNILEIRVFKGKPFAKMI